MDYHVGSLASIINQNAHSQNSSTKLFENISSSTTQEIKFKVIPVNKKRRVIEEEPLAKRKKNKIKSDESDDDIPQAQSKSRKQINAKNAEKRIKGLEVKSKEREGNPEEDNRTIFVGNLPCNIKLIKLKKLFKPYGEIESARFRCPPVSDPRIPKRVAVIKKEFHPERTNIVGYVRFVSEKEARNALQANGMLFRDHHLRVDLASRNGTHDQKKAVFVGNLHFGAEENDLWNIFETCGPIDSIRIVRDSVTGVGKGFCYVNFKDLSSVELALQLEGHMLKDRPLRIARAVKKIPRKREELRNWPGARRKIPKDKNAEKGKKPSRKQDSGWEEGDRNKGGKARKPKKRMSLSHNIGKEKKVKEIAKQEPSYQGTTGDDIAPGKKKKKKFSKAELKKRVLAFQLQLKKINGPDSKKK